MAKMTCTVTVKLPWWYRARLSTLKALVRVGFHIDLDAEARDIVRCVRITLT